MTAARDLEIDEATARKVIEEANAKRAREADEARLAKRDQDRKLTRPWHFHATVWTFVEKDAGGNMKDATHHETAGLSVDTCIRKARNRAEPGQDLYHMQQLTECPDPTHSTRELAD